MTAWAGSLVILTSLVLLARWLGWGRRTTWEQASGWEVLDPAEKAHFEQAARDWKSEAGRPDIFWNGHGSVEVVWEEDRVLVDPVCASRIKIAPRWFDQPCPDPGAPVATICLTHAHMDHLDNPTLVKLPSARLLLPRGSERFLSRRVRQRHQVEPLGLSESVKAGHMEIIPVPARHGGWRYPWQRGLFACGYVLKRDGIAVYVAGDTAYGPHFREIGAAYAPDLAVLPIGAYAPQWFLQKRHLNPAEALSAAADLGVRTVVPVHFGTYRLSLERMQEPLRWFATAARESGQACFLPLRSR